MEELTALVSSSRQDRKPRPKHPTGWEPGAGLAANGEGFLIPAPRPLEGLADPDVEPWEDHLRKAGLNPELVEVVPPVEIRTWDAAVGDGVVRTMVYFKARVRQRSQRGIDPELAAWILKWKPTTKPVRTSSDLTVVVPWGDWQVGKGDGDGTAGTVSRIVNSFSQTVDYLKAQKPSQILVAPLGDLFENCTGHYAQQSWRTEQNMREQEHTVRRLIVAGLKAFSDIAPVLVLPVGGNHGENRQDGASFTDFSDNFDVGVFDAVSDQLAENPRFDHVRFHIPRADLTQTVDVHGHVIGLFHGHQAKTGASVPVKIENWWKGQMKARAPIGDADILVNGHYHTFLARSLGPRFHVQIPALDGGSDWFDQTAGGREPAGQVVFTVTADGWDNLRVLPAPRLP